MGTCWYGHENPRGSARCGTCGAAVLAGPAWPAEARATGRGGTAVLDDWLAGHAVLLGMTDLVLVLVAVVAALALVW